jgi:hypothetical protein
MYEYELMGAVNNLFDVNDRLGVELMGAGVWNGLKRAVTTLSANAIRNAKTATKGVKGFSRPRVFLRGDDDQLCRALWGFNDDYAAELLGYSVSDLWRQTKKVTHKVLEAGENVPVVDAAVSRFRDITGAITGAKDAADVAQTAYDNRGKIILIGGGAAVLLYFLLRKKKR